jgi:hypothetical protein
MMPVFCGLVKDLNAWVTRDLCIAGVKEDPLQSVGRDYPSSIQYMPRSERKTGNSGVTLDLDSI